MPPDLAQRIRVNPDFITLESARGVYSRLICAAMLVIYFGFILVVAFRPDLMARPVGGGITMAFPVGIGVILSAIALTGLYVLRANGQFDRLTARVRRDTR